MRQRASGERSVSALPAAQTRLYDALGSILWLADSDGNTTFVNAAWAEYTGTAREVALGQSFAQAIHPEDRGAALTRWTQAWLAGEPYRAEFRLRRHDGAYRWHVSEGRPCPGEVQIWAGLCTDVHGRVEAEAQVRALSGQLRGQGARPDYSARLLQVAQALGRSLRREDVLGAALDAVREVLGARYGVVLEQTLDGQALAPVSTFGYDEALVRAWPRLPLAGRFPTAQVARTGRAIFVRDRAELAQEFPDSAQASAALDYQSGAYLPLLGGGRLLGCLAALWTAERDFGEEERGFLGTLAGLVAQALDRARRYEDERRARLRVEGLQGLASVLARTVETAGVVAAILDAGRAVSGAYAGAVSVVVPERGTLELLDQAGFSAEHAARWACMPLSLDTPGTAAARTGAAEFINLDAAQAQYSELPALASPVSRAFATLPLRGSGGEVFGVLGFSFEAEQRFDEEERAFLLALAASCAQALERARLLDAERGARAAAERSEGRYRALLGATPQTVWTADAQGQSPETSSWWQALTGQTPAQAVGWGWLQAVHPQDRERVQAAWTRALSALEPFEARYRIRAAGGETRAVVARGVPRIEGGAFVEWVGTFEDVTEGERAERARAEGEMRLRLALEASGLGLWTLDLGTGTVEHSPEARRLLGAVPQTEPWQAHLDRLPPGEGEVVRVRLAGALESGETRFSLRHRLLHPDGRVVWLEQHHLVERGDGGAATRVIGTTRDVTAEVEAHAQLRDGAARLEAALEYGHLGLWEYDFQSGHNAWMGAMPALYGLAPGEYQGDPEGLARLVHPDDRARLLEASARAARGEGGELDETFRVVWPGGEVRWLRSTARLRRAEDGTPLGLLGVNYDLTGLKAAELALRESREQLELAFDAAELGLWDWNLRTGTQHWSARQAALYGLAPEERAGDLGDFFSQVHPEDRASIEAALPGVLAGGRYDHEFRIVRPDGEVRWLRGLGHVQRGEDGEPARMIGVNYDVTGRKQAEQALRASQGQLQALLDHTEAVLYVQDLSGHYLTVNRRWRELFSGGEDVTGKHPTDVFAPEFAAQFWASYGQVLDAPGALVVEETAPHPDGLHTYISVKFALRDASGRPYALGGMSTDITAHKALEEELRALNASLEERVAGRTAELAAERGRTEVLAQLRATLQAVETPEDVRALDLGPVAAALGASALAVVSRRGDTFEAATVWGTPPEPLRTVLARLPQRLADAPTLARAARDRQEPPFGVHSEQPGAADGIEDTPGATPLYAADGALLGFVLAAWPAHGGAGAPEVQALLRRVADSLALSLERVRITGELRAANAQLQRSNAELERFAYVASHDLQEPIRTVTSFAELLERKDGEALGEAGRRRLALVRGGALRLKTLVDDLLHYSRLGGDSPALGTVDLTVPVSEALGRLQVRLAESGAQFAHDPLPVVLGHGPQLAQLFQNLLGNALKFVRPGVTPVVHLGAVREGAWWHLTVSDNGIGIEEEYLERIFVLFQRLHPRDRYEGTGLGLSICRKIVETHGGRLWAESAPTGGAGGDKGATFHILLRAAPDA